MEPLENALAHAGDYEEEWKRAMIAMFKALALNACNGHHLERLHAALPENYRLIREDLLLLKKIVAQLRPKGAKADHAPPDDAILDMLASIRGEARMREYYASVLAHRSFGDRVIAPSFYFNPDGILDCKPELKREITCIWPKDAEGVASHLPDHETQWEGRRVTLEFARVKEPLRIEVRILFLEPNYTEPFVHRVRTTFATNTAYTLVPRGSDLEMWYSFADAEGLMQLTERAEEKKRLERGPLSVTTNAFLTAIRERFAAEGIAFGEIQPRERRSRLIHRLDEMIVSQRQKPQNPSKKDAPPREKLPVVKRAEGNAEILK